MSNKITIRLQKPTEERITQGWWTNCPLSRFHYNGLLLLSAGYQVDKLSTHTPSLSVFHRLICSSNAFHSLCKLADVIEIIANLNVTRVDISANTLLRRIIQIANLNGATIRKNEQVIHNYVIVNNVNFYTGKTFETEHNQGKIPDRAWSKLRTISDELCRKHGLSIIENPHLSKGKSHWGWELDKQNLSWKEQLKRTIDEVIKVSEDFEDFLAKCADFGILVDYNPEHKIDLKFMLAEQKERNPRAKFTRAKTLGYFYESQQIKRRIESYKYQMSHRPTARIIRTTAEKFQQSQGLTNWADRENMKAASQALNEMNASNSTLEELESAAHRAFAEFMVMSTPQMELSDRIHKMEEQIPAIEKYHEFVAYHKKYTSLEGKAKTKYKSDFCYELDEYHKAYKKLIELFPDAHIPKLSKLKTELEKARTDYAQQSAERKALKKEADRLSRLAQQKRDSQRTLARYMQNEQAAKRKKGQLEQREEDFMSRIGYIRVSTEHQETARQPKSYIIESTMVLS